MGLRGGFPLVLSVAQGYGGETDICETKAKGIPSIVMGQDAMLGVPGVKKNSTRSIREEK